MPKPIYLFPKEKMMIEDALGKTNVIVGEVYRNYKCFVPLETAFIYVKKPEFKLGKATEKALQLGVILYRGVIEGNKNFDNRHRFVRISGLKSIPESRRNVHLRIEDLATRVQGNHWEICNEDLRNKGSADPPFRAWHLDGSLLKDSSFYIELFAKSKAWIEYDETLFIRYCMMASSACVPPKEPYSVISRFFDKKVDEVVLYYASAPKYQPLLEDKVEKTIKKRGHKATQQSFVPHQIIYTPEALIKEDCFQCIGIHPLKLYSTWVTRYCAKKLEKAGAIEDSYILSDLSGFVRDGDHGSKFLELKGGKNGEDQVKLYLRAMGAKTATNVTKLKISAARNQSRDPTQAVAMGIGSNAAAKQIWTLAQAPPLKRVEDAEWLHRSAFSYGGLNDEQGNTLGSSSSQLPGNMILGTKATNTNMIRVEQFIKRFVVHTGKSVKVVTETLDDTGCAVEHQSNWSAPILRYRFELPSHNSRKGEQCELSFKARERVTPLRFDFEVGELFDAALFGYTKKDSDEYEELNETESPIYGPDHMDDNNFKAEMAQQPEKDLEFS